MKPRGFKNIKKLPVKYYANKKAWMTTAIFMEFLRALDATTGVQGRNVCGQLCCSSARYAISKERKSCVLSTKLHKRVTTS
jgi:hypothetical protein